MSMKKIVLALTVALMGTIVMNAQPSRHHDMNPEQMVEKRVERLDKALALTAEQKAEITSIYSEEMKDNHKAKPQRMDKGERPDEATMAAHREQMKAQRESTDAKVKALLTPEQAAKYEKMQTERKRGHGKRHMGLRGDADKAPRNDNGCKDKCTCKDK